MDGIRKDEVSYPRLRKTNTVVMSPRCSLTSKFYKGTQDGGALRERGKGYTCALKMEGRRNKEQWWNCGRSYWNLRMLIVGAETIA